jgi:hypothetical protein
MSPEDKELITKAYTNALNQLNLKLPKQSTNYQVLFLRFYQNLSTTHGDDKELMSHWLNQYNTHLMFTPNQMISQERYLMQIIDYLEGFISK